MRIALLAFLLCACTAKKIERPSAEITFKNGRLLYHSKEFSGIVVEKFPNVGTVRETEYKSGLPHGVQNETNVDSGQLVARREYTQGNDSGIHEGWFVDGKRRFHYEYDAQGKTHGDSWEWHQSGHPSLFARFEHGQLKGKKMWREDGKIYMNWVFSPERAYGTPGTKLCIQLRDP